MFAHAFVLFQPSVCKSVNQRMFRMLEITGWRVRGRGRRLALIKNASDAVAFNDRELSINTPIRQLTSSTYILIRVPCSPCPSNSPLARYLFDFPLRATSSSCDSRWRAAINHRAANGKLRQPEISFLPFKYRGPLALARLRYARSFAPSSG